jgi:hypothetical protein
MTNAYQSLYHLIQRETAWWELLPVREDIALALASDKKFWRKHGHRFGWHSLESPFDHAMREAKLANFEAARSFYESPIFEDDLQRTKVGSWCGWVSMKHVLQHSSISYPINLEIEEPV